MLFTFDDIVKLSSKARMLIFDQIATERIVTALKGADTTFRELIFDIVGFADVPAVVEHELATGIPANQREILDARTGDHRSGAGNGRAREIELNPEQEDQQVFT